MSDMNDVASLVERARNAGYTFRLVGTHRRLEIKGKPGPFTAANIAVATARPLLARMPFDASAIDEVILGCVMP